MKKKSPSSKKPTRYRPIFICRDGKPIHMTTRYKTRELAKKRYCEQNDIGGHEALRLSTKTLDQIREEKKNV